MSTRLLSLVMSMAFRRARRDGGRLWWLVVALAWLIRRGEKRRPESQSYRVRRGHDLDVRVAEGGR